MRITEVILVETNELQARIVQDPEKVDLDQLRNILPYGQGSFKAIFGGLKAVAADRKKKAAFDKFMAKMGEGVEEGDGRKKGVHGKGHPMRKKQQAAIDPELGESYVTIY